jgi:hypothetical protein
MLFDMLLRGGVIQSSSVSSAEPLHLPPFLRALFHVHQQSAETPLQRYQRQQASSQQAMHPHRQQNLQESMFGRPRSQQPAPVIDLTADDDDDDDDNDNDNMRRSSTTTTNNVLLREATASRAALVDLTADSDSDEPSLVTPHIVDVVERDTATASTGSSLSPQIIHHNNTVDNHATDNADDAQNSVEELQHGSLDLPIALDQQRQTLSQRERRRRRWRPHNNRSIDDVSLLDNDDDAAAATPVTMSAPM